MILTLILTFPRTLRLGKDECMSVLQRTVFQDGGGGGERASRWTAGAGWSTSREDDGWLDVDVFSLSVVRQRVRQAGGQTSLSSCSSLSTTPSLLSVEGTISTRFML